MASVPLPRAPAVFRGVSCRWLPLAGSATFLAPVSWPTPAVGTCCWVGGVFSAPLGFLPCAVLFLRGLRFAQLPLPQLTHGGFSAFSVTRCLTYWWRGLDGNPSLIFLCFSCAGWLAGVCWVLHPVSGSSRWGCVCSLGDSVMTLLAFPYLRVGALLAWGVYGVSCCEVCSLGCPSWLVLLFMSLVCPSPALWLGWFGHRSVAPPAAPGCWALLGSRLRRSVALASGRTLSLCFLARVFLPWVFFRTWVGRLRSCLASCLLLGELTFPCPGFRLAVPAVDCPGSWCFLGIFPWVLSSRFQCLLMAWGGYS